MNKSLLVLLVAAGISAQTVRADLKSVFGKFKEAIQEATPMLGKPKVYGVDAGIPSAEFFNKGKENIFVAIKSGDTFYAEQGNDVFLVRPGTKQKLNPDISQEVEVLLWKTKPASSGETPTMRYKVGPTGKTVYLSWNSATAPNALRPQSGVGKETQGIVKKFGVDRRTDTGYNLDKPGNVTEVNLVRA